MSVHEIIARFNKAYARKALLTKDVRSKRRKIRVLTLDVKALEKSRYILTEVGKMAQDRMRRKIESLVTLAIRNVFDRPLTFKLIFEEKRNHIEARPVILEGKEEFVPKEDLGGSIIVVISFALRIVLWHLSSPRTRNVFILDEPFQFTGVLIEKAGEMLQHLSKELGFQVIMISHDDELINVCDRVYRITHDGTESVVKLIKGQRKISRR